MKSNPQAPSNEWQGRQIGNHTASSSGTFGAQKRPGSDSLERPSKKPKVSCAPRLGKNSVIIYYEFLLTECLLYLVTKPFNSTAGLSKPFRPPSFVRPQVGLVQTVPIPATAEKSIITVATREPSIDLELPEHSDEDLEETENRERTSVQLNN